MNGLYVYLYRCTRARDVKSHYYCSDALII